MSKLRRFFMRAPIGLYRIWLGGVMGSRFLLLEHVGRSSGLPRKVVLEVVERSEDGTPVIVSGFGEQSQWFQNISADPGVWYTIGRTRTRATAQRIEHGEALQVFERYRIDHPRAAKAIGKRIGVSLVDDPGAAARQLPLFRLVAGE